MRLLTPCKMGPRCPWLFWLIVELAAENSAVASNLLKTTQRFISIIAWCSGNSSPDDIQLRYNFMSLMPGPVFISNFYLLDSKWLVHMSGSELSLTG